MDQNIGSVPPKVHVELGAFGLFSDKAHAFLTKWVENRCGFVRLEGRAHGIWWRHPSVEWGDHAGGLGGVFQSEGLAALWIRDSVGWNAKPEGTGGCRAWIPGQRVLEFHKSDEEPEAARALRGLPYLAQSRSAHEQVALTQRGLIEAWPQWMMGTIFQTA